ncbi:PREDICTED: uncharacterized protein LOC109113948 [Nelumbo nucifera]|uniref:Uncharacterized protein LOC109113948 n=1 Tax=Nelumbo nucifera TaxID=4432 RepID=A0A1U8PY27_NELNU|nr:PREDICTED: uncharacterized protein LOC109113948 [Nelumbo nucifera]
MSKAIKEEVDKQLGINFVREVHYPKWPSNVVVVRKANGKLRICIDFVHINKAFPKDSFPLPRIDHLVNATTRYELLSFMDAFSGYNQIKKHLIDEEKTSFIIEHSTYYYKVMPFGLNNVEAAYQRQVNEIFRDQIRRNIEAYVGHMVVKSLRAIQHTSNIGKTFGVLRKYNMKLNPTKFTFGVPRENSWVL